jgi:hypothetical protein
MPLFRWYFPLILFFVSDVRVRGKGLAPLFIQGKVFERLPAIPLLTAKIHG